MKEEVKMAAPIYVYIRLTSGQTVVTVNEINMIRAMEIHRAISIFK